MGGSPPGQEGEIIGLWWGRKISKALTLAFDVWEDEKIPRREPEALAEDYAQFQQLRLDKLTR